MHSTSKCQKIRIFFWKQADIYYLQFKISLKSVFLLNSNLFGAHWSPMEPTGASWSQLAWATVTTVIHSRSCSDHTHHTAFKLAPTSALSSLSHHPHKKKDPASFKTQHRSCGPPVLDFN